MTDLEQKVDALRELPARVEGLEEQILQLRTETRGEFSAVRGEMASGFAAVRGEMAAGFAAVRGEMAAEFAAVRGEMATEFAAVRGEMAAGFTAVRGEMAQEFAAVRAEIKAGDEETRTYMRVLHEDALVRIGVVAEGHEETRRQVGVLQESVASFREEVLARFAALEAHLVSRRPKRR